MVWVGVVGGGVWGGGGCFFFNDTATTEIYTLSLHDALPIYHGHFHNLSGLTRTAYLNRTLRSSLHIIQADVPLKYSNYAVIY